MAIQQLPPVRSDPDPSARPTIVLDGIKILVVDDDPDDLALVATLLGRARADVITAHSVEEAVLRFRTGRFDVVVSDIAMPDCDGYQLMRMLRARTEAEGGRTPAIALTGHTRPEDHTRALLAGYHVHLPKPFAAIELLLTIRGLVETSRSPI